jgi:hypothetical protein
MTWMAVAVGGGALISGLGSFLGGKSQANAAKNAQAISQQEFNLVQKQESPYMQGGYQSLASLLYGLGVGPQDTPGTHTPRGQGAYGNLTKPFTTQDWQQLSPAYNFQRQQGMQGSLNGNAAGQGALSGAAQKDLMSYNQNLANTSFNNAFNMYQTQQGNIYERLAGLAHLGQAATSNTAAQGTALAGQAAQSAQNYGSAMGGAYAGLGGAVGTGISALPWLMKSGGFGGGGGGGGSADETALAYSDRRLKEDIERIGTLDSGLPIYRFRYRGTDQIFIGVMADEAADKFPDAVSADSLGYLMVDYGKIY